jgi:hypothetical protein
MMRMTPQEEAIQLIGQVLDDLISPNRDLKSILRRCQHACELLSWDAPQSWFNQELNGYHDHEDLPSYRKIQGRLVWKPTGSASEKLNWQISATIHGLEPKDAAEEDATLKIVAGIDWLLGEAQRGYTEITDQTRDGWLRSKHRKLPLQRERVFPAAAFGTVVAEIERGAFDFASKAYVQLRYGNVLTDIWADYRKQVDGSLHQLGFSDYLDAIHSGLQSDNPESWRSAVLECRNLLKDVANFLWQDPRPTYDLLDGKGADGKLQVTQDKFVNQLNAYLHQKGLSGTRGRFLRDEAERLGASIRSLAAFQAEAHDPMRREDARSCALATYFILGELVIKTDMEPIETHGEPSDNKEPP